jgi:hypothetical protein
MPLDLLLILGCFMLGCVVAYAWWVAVRPTLFRIDLLKIAEDLVHSESREGSTPSEFAKSILGTILFLHHIADAIDLPILLHIGQSASERSNTDPLERSEVASPTLQEITLQVLNHLSSKETPPHVRYAVIRTLWRVLRYLFLETFVGWFFLSRFLFLSLFGSWRKAFDRLMFAFIDLARREDPKMSHSF